MIRKFKSILIGFVSVTLLWFGLYLFMDVPIIPNPFDTYTNVVRIFPLLFKHMIASSFRILVGIGISLVLGVVLGVLMAQSKVFNSLIAPLVYILNPLPKIAFLPIFMVLFGLGEVPKIMVIISVILFQFIFAAKDSIDAIPFELKQSFMSLNPSKKDIFRYLILPSMLPKLFTALRISFGVSVSILFFGETFQTTYGMGYYIMSRWDVVNYLDMYSGIVVLGLFGFVIYMLLDVLQEKYCDWMY